MKFREAFRLGVCVGFGVIGYDVVRSCYGFAMRKLVDRLNEDRKEEE